ncbi:MAG TPA: YetF domain-containing protein [Opitutaceae bacterium]
MDKSQIHLTDWHRILFGDAPALFLVEVFVRAIVTYVLLLIAVRLLGKRMSGQLTVMELAVMLTLGAIVSVAMQMPDRGILLGIWVLLLALIFQRGTTWLDWISPKFETITEGRVSIIVQDGILNLNALRIARLSREQVFAILRERKVYNLGSVKRLYFEACGDFSVYLMPEPHPGLSTLPISDPEAKSQQPMLDHSTWVCATCGQVMETTSIDAACPHCGRKTWERPTVQAQTAS